MKVGLLHFDLDAGPQEKNTAQLLDGIRKAAEAGARWIVTPEMALQGYHMTQTGHLYTIASRNNSLLDPFLEIAKELQVTLFIGCAFESEGKFYNAVVIIDQWGRFVGFHGKIKTVPYETEDWAVSGTRLENHRLEYIRVGLLVCADAFYSDLAAVYKHMKTQLLIVSAAWPAQGCGGPAREAWLRTHVASDQVPMIVCNQTGDHAFKGYTCESAILFNGHVVCAYAGEPAILVHEISTPLLHVPEEEFMVIPWDDTLYT